MQWNFFVKDRQPDSLPEAQESQTSEGGKKGQNKEHFLMYTIKCMCGDVLSRHMKHCPGCGEAIETVLEHLKREFYRVNFYIPEQAKEKQN